MTSISAATSVSLLHLQSDHPTDDRALMALLSKSDPPSSLEDSLRGVLGLFGSLLDYSVIIWLG